MDFFGVDDRRVVEPQIDRVGLLVKLHLQIVPPVASQVRSNALFAITNGVASVAGLALRACRRR